MAFQNITRNTIPVRPDTARPEQRGTFVHLDHPRHIMERNQLMSVKPMSWVFDVYVEDENGEGTESQKYSLDKYSAEPLGGAWCFMAPDGQVFSKDIPPGRGTEGELVFHPKRGQDAITKDATFKRVDYEYTFKKAGVRSSKHQGNSWEFLVDDQAALAARAAVELGGAVGGVGPAAGRRKVFRWANSIGTPLTQRAEYEKEPPSEPIPLTEEQLSQFFAPGDKVVLTLRDPVTRVLSDHDAVLQDIRQNDKPFASWSFLVEGIDETNRGFLNRRGKPRVAQKGIRVWQKDLGKEWSVALHEETLARREEQAVREAAALAENKPNANKSGAGPASGENTRRSRRRQSRRRQSRRRLRRRSRKTRRSH